MKKIFFVLLALCIGCGGYQIRQVKDDFDNKTFYQVEIWHWADYSSGYVITDYKRSYNNVKLSPITAEFKLNTSVSMNSLKNTADIIIDGKRYSVALSSTKGVKNTWTRSSSSSNINSSGISSSSSSSSTDLMQYEPKLVFTEEMMKNIINANDYKIRFNFANDKNVTITCSGKELKAIKDLANYQVKK